MTRFRHEHRDGFHWLSGFMDEHADFKAIKVGPEPLRLNFRRLESINSIGVARFTNFTDSWGTTPVEFHECPIMLLDAMIMLPALLGPEENTGRIMSLNMVFHCAACRSQSTRLLQAKDLTAHGEDVKFPAQSCERCSGAVLVDEVGRELVALFENGALGR